MRKSELISIIKDTIRDKAVAKLSGKGAPKKQEEPFDENHFDSLLFNGGYADGIRRHFGIHESKERIKVQLSDIKDFESEMQNLISPIPNATLQFDKQENGYSMMIKNISGSIGVFASGNIIFGNEGKIKWFFSIPNGVRLETDGLEITQDNKFMIEELYNYYVTWQKDWRLKLQDPQYKEEPELNLGAEQPTMEPEVGGAAPEEPQA